jgi:hypothetical protein
MTVNKKEPLVTAHLNFMVTEVEAKWLRARAAKASKEAGRKVSLSATVRDLVTGTMTSEREARLAVRRARQAGRTPAE